MVTGLQSLYGGLLGVSWNLVAGTLVSSPGLLGVYGFLLWAPRPWETFPGLFDALRYLMPRPEGDLSWAFNGYMAPAMWPKMFG